MSVGTTADKESSFFKKTLLRQKTIVFGSRPSCVSASPTQTEPWANSPMRMDSIDRSHNTNMKDSSSPNFEELKTKTPTKPYYIIDA